MSSVQIISWEKIQNNYIEKTDLKFAQKQIMNSLEQLLKDYSKIKRKKIESIIEDILNGYFPLIPVNDLNKAEKLSIELKKIGAVVIIREIDNACHCEFCETFTVVQKGENPKGFDFFYCLKCHEIKRACPECNGQGWLRHYNVISPFQAERYECDECGSIFDNNWISLTPMGITYSYEEIMGNDKVLIRDFLET